MIYSNGMISDGTINLITGAVFIAYGVYAKEIISNGAITTYGTNDMVLDVWGTLDHWITKKKIMSFVQVV